jgi:hypothetical protein
MNTPGNDVFSIISPENALRINPILGQYKKSGVRAIIDIYFFVNFFFVSELSICKSSGLLYNVPM